MVVQPVATDQRRSSGARRLAAEVEAEAELEADGVDEVGIWLGRSEAEYGALVYTEQGGQLWRGELLTDRVHGGDRGGPQLY